MITLRPQTRQRGFTVVELMVTLSITGILLGIGLPAFGNLVERQQLLSSVETLASDLRRARSEAIARGVASRVEAAFYEGSDGAWSYAIADGPDTIARRSAADYGNAVTISVAPDSPSTMSFSAVRGVALQGQLAVRISSGSASVVVSRNPMGRVSICSNSEGLGYPACSKNGV